MSMSESSTIHGWAENGDDPLNKVPNLGLRLKKDQVSSDRPQSPPTMQKKRRGRKASTLVRLYHLLKEYPLLKNAEISKELGISQDAVRMAKLRLRKYNEITKLSFLYCPSCLVLSLEPCDEGFVCNQCGKLFEKETIKINPFNRGPTNALHWGKGLGSELDCYELKSGRDCFGAKTRALITSKPVIIQSVITNTLEDHATKECLENLMTSIRSLNLDLQITDSLGKLLRAKIRAFKLKYPYLPVEKKIRQSLVLETLALASLDFPRLRESYNSYLEMIKESKRSGIPTIIKEARIEVLQLLVTFGFDRKAKVTIGKLVESVAKEIKIKGVDKEKLKYRAVLSTLEKLSNDFPRTKTTIEEYKAKHNLEASQ